MRPQASDHPGELLLGYLEEALTPEERSRVKRHLAECPECAGELDELRTFVQWLRVHKERIFCPEPLELMRFVQTGEDPEGVIADHVIRCEICSEDVAILTDATGEDPCSTIVRQAFPVCARKRTPVRRPRTGLVWRILGRLSTLRPLPAAVMAAAAAVLLVVLLYPAGQMEPMLGLSTVRWGTSLPKARAKGLVQLPKVAVVIAFSGFKSPIRDDTVNSLYEALRPGPDLLRSHEFIDPADVRSALASTKVEGGNWDGVRARLREAVRPDALVILDVEAQEDLLVIKGRLVAASTGKPQAEETVLVHGGQALPKELKATMVHLLRGERPKGER